MKLLGMLWFGFGGFGALAAGEIRLDGFTTRDGLINNRVTAICERKGRGLWIGTQEGLCRFDGKTFEGMDRYENAPYGRILDLYSDNRNRVWIVAEDAVFVFEHDRFRRLNWSGTDRIKLSYMDSESRLWFTSIEGTVRVDVDGQVAQVDGAWGKQQASVFYEDGAGNLWLGFRFGGLARLSKNGEWRYFDIRDGLPNQTVNSVVDDDQGRVWAATLKGVYVYEDDVFREAPFNGQLPSQFVYDLLVDSRGRLWMNGPRSGLMRWDGRQLERFDPEDGLASDIVVGMERGENGQLWILCNRGVGVYQDEGFLPVVNPDVGKGVIRVFFRGSGGLIWLGADTGLYRYETPPLETYIEDPSDKIQPAASASRQIVRDSKGNLWFPSLVGLGFYDNREFRVFTTKDGLAGDEIHALFEDSRGAIWVGAEGGVSVGGTQGFRPVRHGALAKRNATRFMEDKRGRLWVQDREQTVWLNPEPNRSEGGFRSIPFESVLNLHAADDGSVWIEGGRKLYRYDEKLKEYPFGRMMANEGRTIRNSARVFLPQGLWLQGADAGVYGFDGKVVRSLRSGGEPLDAPFALAFDGKDGEVWFQSLKPPPVYPARMIPNGVARYVDGSMELFSAAEAPLTDHFMLRVFVDNRGNRWLFTRKGATLFNLERDEIRVFTVADGLAGNRPTDLLFDADDCLWIATNGGLNKVQGEAITTISIADGLLDAQVSDIELDADQRLWIRTKKGVQRYRENATPPPVEIASLLDGDKPLDLDDVDRLSHVQNNLVFHLSTVYLARGASELQYAYTLFGEERQWTGVTREPRLHFPGLKPGAYLLEVKAYNRDLFASESPVNFSFIIRTPFWLRPWFLTAAILSALLLGYGLYRLRLSGKLEKARVFNELRTAQTMQMSLMPKAPPQLDGLEIYGACEPAREVGGDFFDYFLLEEGRRRLGFAVMDVSGKSMEAAIISVMTSGLVYGEMGSGQSPGMMLTRINGPLFQKTGKQTFTTGLVGSIDLAEKRLRWSNAGHADPIVIREGKSLTLPPPQRRELPLGARPQWSYGERELQLRKGDLLVVYTDGVDEATSPSKQLFGKRRLMAILQRGYRLPARDLVEKTLAEIAAFSGAAPQHDDITLIAVKVTG